MTAEEQGCTETNLTPVQLEHISPKKGWWLPFTGLSPGILAEGSEVAGAKNLVGEGTVNRRQATSGYLGNLTWVQHYSEVLYVKRRGRCYSTEPVGLDAVQSQALALAIWPQHSCSQLFSCTVEMGKEEMQGRVRPSSAAHQGCGWLSFSDDNVAGSCPSILIGASTHSAALSGQGATWGRYMATRVFVWLTGSIFQPERHF